MSAELIELRMLWRRPPSTLRRPSWRFTPRRAVRQRRHWRDGVIVTARACASSRRKNSGHAARCAVVNATLAGRDPSTDLAVLKCAEAGNRRIEIGDASTIKPAASVGRRTDARQRSRGGAGSGEPGCRGTHTWTAPRFPHISGWMSTCNPPPLVAPWLICATKFWESHRPLCAIRCHCYPSRTAIAFAETLLKKGRIRAGISVCSAAGASPGSSAAVLATQRKDRGHHSRGRGRWAGPQSGNRHRRHSGVFGGTTHFAS